MKPNLIVVRFVCVSESDGKIIVAENAICEICFRLGFFFLIFFLQCERMNFVLLVNEAVISKSTTNGDQIHHQNQKFWVEQKKTCIPLVI